MSKEEINIVLKQQIHLHFTALQLKICVCRRLTIEREAKSLDETETRNVES